MRGVSMLFSLEKKYNVHGSLVCPPKSTKEYLRFIFIILRLTFFRSRRVKVVIQQVIDQSFYAKMLLFLSKRRNDIVYDVDCSVNHLSRVQTYNAFLQNAKTVVSGSQWVQKYVQNSGGESYYLPTPVVPQKDARLPKNFRLNIGWIADYRLNESEDETLSNLNVLTEILVPVMKELDFPVKLELIGLSKAKDRNQIREALRGYHLIELCMPSEIGSDEQRALQERMVNWDLALCPNTEHLFNLTCSSHLNQMILSAGVPLIVSDIGEHAKLIRHGVNGWKCDSVAQFLECTKVFANLSQEQKQSMREAALKSVACRNLASTSERFAEWILDDSVRRTPVVLQNSKLGYKHSGRVKG